MTYKEAADRIEEYIRRHYSEECTNAILITEALQTAVCLLRERVDLEECAIAVKKRTPVWYVDFELGEIEEVEILEVHYKDGRIDSFSVNFKESGDFDEFVVDAIGDNFFASREMAETALVKGHSLKLEF